MSIINEEKSVDIKRHRRITPVSLYSKEQSDDDAGHSDA